MFRLAPLVPTHTIVREDSDEMKACNTAFDNWMSERQWTGDWQSHFRAPVQTLIREVGGHIQAERKYFDVPTLIQINLTKLFAQKLASRAGAAAAAQECTAAVFTPFMNNLVEKISHIHRP